MSKTEQTDTDCVLRTYGDLSESGADNQVCDPFDVEELVVVDYSDVFDAVEEGGGVCLDKWRAKHGTLWRIEQSLVEHDTVTDEGHQIHEWTRRYIVTPAHKTLPKSEDRWNVSSERLRHATVWDGEADFYYGL